MRQAHSHLCLSSDRTCAGAKRIFTNESLFFTHFTNNGPGPQKFAVRAVQDLHGWTKSTRQTC